MKNLRLAMKLGIGFGVVLALTALLSISSWSGMSSILDRVDKADAMTDIIKMVLETRRQEKNFQIRHDQASQEEVTKNVAGILAKAQTYKGKFSDSGNREKMEQVLVATKAYDTAFKSYVGRETTRAQVQKTMAGDGLSALASTEALQQSLKQEIATELGSKHAATGLDARVNALNDSGQLVAQIWSMRLAVMYFLQTSDETYSKKGVDIGANAVKLAEDLKSRLKDKTSIDQAEQVSRNTAAYIQSTSDLVQAVRDKKTMEAQLIESARQMLKVCETARQDMKDKMFAEISWSRSLLAIGAILALVLGAFAALLITRAITGPVRKGLAFAKQLSDGHLDVRIDVDQKDEVGALAAALTDMAGRLRTVVLQVNASAESVASGSQELSASSETLSQGATEQAASVEEISSSVEEMASNIRQNAENALQTESLAKKSADDARQGGQAVIQTVDAMRQIVEKISFIEEIARQTNLLALNAAIEAARAGEHGKGFAVVAAEVRKLAERSGAAAGEIGQLSAASLAVAEKAGGMLATIVPDIERTSELVQEISAACREQTTGADQVNKAIQQLDHVIQQNASASEETASTSEELAAQAQRLTQVMQFFKLSKGRQGPPLAIEAAPAPRDADEEPEDNRGFEKF
ncbi:MAG: methyl-accepting chemotaxis protein [Humidesulfovibrio sp.]|nr:methyl-accepting chemotaxis protein [Humidesulfovibrio sp.]